MSLGKTAEGKFAAGFKVITFGDWRVTNQNDDLNCGILKGSTITDCSQSKKVALKSAFMASLVPPTESSTRAIFYKWLLCDGSYFRSFTPN